MKAKKYVASGLLLGAFLMCMDMQSKAWYQYITGQFSKGASWVKKQLTAVSKEQQETLANLAITAAANQLGIEPDKTKELINTVNVITGGNDKAKKEVISDVVTKAAEKLGASSEDASKYGQIVSNLSSNDEDKKAEAFADVMSGLTEELQEKLLEKAGISEEKAGEIIESIKESEAGKR